MGGCRGDPAFLPHPYPWGHLGPFGATFSINIVILLIIILGSCKKTPATISALPSPIHNPGDVPKTNAVAGGGMGRLHGRERMRKKICVSMDMREIGHNKRRCARVAFLGTGIFGWPAIAKNAATMCGRVLKNVPNAAARSVRNWPARIAGVMSAIRCQQFESMIPSRFLHRAWLPSQSTD
jgi:hypothetical protein